MRSTSKNKMLDATEFEEEAARRFPDTPRHKLRERMLALGRRRARNKMRRESRQKQ